MVRYPQPDTSKCGKPDIIIRGLQSRCLTARFHRKYAQECAKYRWNLHPRIGLVGFAGVATVHESVNPDNDGKILPGIGTGFRFTADTETHMNVGMDIAVGLDDWGIYFRLGEAF